MNYATADDTSLLRAAVGGDRSAFGQIVGRYQNLICAITYSGTGNLALSQDLAQETFLIAWKRLATLQEPGRLRFWLSGIARNVIANARRARERRAEVPLANPETDSMAAAGETPPDRLISQEEQALMWRALEQLPEEYREPLVLYYRQGQQVDEVAQSLALSPDAVRQRLTRGRRMLAEQVAQVVERGLAATRPTQTFALVVLAALPATVPSTAAAGVVAAGAKSAVAPASLAWLGAALGPLVGLLGAAMGVWASLRAARSPRERARIKRFTWIMVAYVALFNVALAGAIWLATIAPVPVTAAVLSLLAVIYLVGLFVLIRRWNQQLAQIRQEDGTESLAPAPPALPARGHFVVALAGSVFGSAAWLLTMALSNRDWLVGGIVLILATMLWALASHMVWRHPDRFHRIAAWVVAGVGLLNLVVLNLRWNHWTHHEPVFYGLEHLPVDVIRWATNVILAAIFLLVILTLLHRQRRPRRGTEK